MRTAGASLIALTSLLAACGGGGDGGITNPPPGGEPVAAVVVTPAEATVGVDEQVELTTETRAGDGTVLAGRAVTWASSDEAVATVDPTNGARTVVTGLAEGTATITATSEGRRGAAEISVQRLVGFQLAVAPSVDTVVIGQAVQFRAEVRELDGTPVPETFTWSAKDQDPAAVVAEVDPATGVVTGLAAGEAVIVATPAARGGTGSARVLVLAFEQVSAGRRHTCGVTTAGAAYCWGDNEQDQLGDGTTIPQRIRPRPVAGGLSFEAVSAGAEHTCGVATGGAAYCWGRNEIGWLGDGTTTDRPAPTAVSDNHSFAMVDAGTTHTCGVSRSGIGYCWGENRWGQLGDGTTNNHSAPVAVATASPPPLALDFVQIGVGPAHTCAVSPRGAASCWGRNDLGELGDGTTLTRLTPAAVAPPMGQSTPLAFTALSLGNLHTCGLTGSGVIYCWGSNTSGQLGDGTTVNRPRPAPVQALVSFVATAAGATHACGLGPTGRAYCWGSNHLGELGDGTTTSRTTPVAVSGDLSFTSLTAGSGHTCGVTADGRAYCWGSNSGAKLGTGTGDDSLVPVAVVSP
ncbi:MAG: Ig-like domain-containing protein [Gemmatimonadales bacterium]